MKLKLLILFLFTLCAQMVAATDKKKNGRFKKIVGLLLLNYLALNAPTTQTNALCPATLPPYATDMMHYIHCADKEQTVDFFDKYLENQDVEVCSSYKLQLKNLYEKVKKLGKCAKEKYYDIVEGAKQRLAGKTTDRNTEVEMFQEYVLNLEGVDEAVEGVDKAEKLSKSFDHKYLYEPDFFKFKSALDVETQMYPLWALGKYPMSPPGYVELTLGALKNREDKPQFRDLNYEQVNRLIPFLKNVRGTDKYYMALDQKYQAYDLDRSEKVLQVLKDFSPDEPDNEKAALEPWIQQKDFSSEKIDKIYKKCKNVKHQRQCWKLKTKGFYIKNSDL